MRTYDAKEKRMMRAVSSSFDRITRLELPLCRYCHQVDQRVLDFFSWVSKVGDGHYWYVVLGLIMMVQGPAARPMFAHVLVLGVTCHVLYRLLKRKTARERPLAIAEGIQQVVPPLDRYSFPSGHTLHVVTFTAVVCTYFPALAWCLVPFALLVAISRVVLGLHYPTDVLAGMVLGIFLAFLSFQAEL